MGDFVKRLTYVEAMTNLADYEATNSIISTPQGRITVIVMKLTTTPKVVFLVEEWGELKTRRRERGTLKEALALLGIEEDEEP